jgi:peptidoglycan/LPS O-acetylase OafA/YrhL
MNPITITPVAAKKYRPDIDGLRAIAVLSVVFFHFGVETFSGGFIGVDVFFVISGFLITRLLIDSIHGQSFTFGGFYLRRARRLLPALLFTIFVSFALACIIFSPQHLERLGGSALHGLLSISNFFFWGESGYFDANGKVKPLLHLWSLSVEEQFYFIWPMTIVFLQSRSFSRAATPLIFVVLGVASWAFAQWCLKVDPSAAFYMLPSRIVEFCMGAIMVQVVGISTRPWVREVALGVGLALIGYSAIVFSEQTPFPGTSALIPCLGTSLAIFGGSSRFLGALLRSKPMVFTGLISYSLYLCHWPIYVFYVYVTGNPQLAPLEVSLLTITAYVVATLMYRFVERPFRFYRAGSQVAVASTRFALGCALASLAIAYISANSWANEGWYWRFGNSGELAEVFDLDLLRNETLDYNRVHIGGATFNKHGQKILVVGDSHARDVSNGLEQILADQGFQVRKLTLDDICLQYINVNGKPINDLSAEGARDCAQQINNFIRSAKTRIADIFVYSSAFSANTSESIGKFVILAQKISKKEGIKIIVMDRAVSFGNLHSKAIRAYARGVSPKNINLYALRAAKGPFYLETIKSELSENGLLDDVVVVSKRKLQCDKSSCDFFTEDGDLAIWDTNHWTLKGAKMFMSRFIAEHPTIFRAH